MSQAPAPELILASTSKARQALLSAAGASFTAIKPNVDEAAVKARSTALAMQELAAELAMQKSVDVSSRHKDSIVIGADQTLDLDGSGFDKPSSLDAARQQLLQLRGRTHHLHSAICCSRNGKPVWQHVSSAMLSMRHFSDAELADYLRLAGDKVLHSVGGYQIEGPAIQLFDHIEGDYFTILGLPLLPLLNFLRNEQANAS